MSKEPFSKVILWITNIDPKPVSNSSRSGNWLSGQYESVKENFDIQVWFPTRIESKSFWSLLTLGVNKVCKIFTTEQHKIEFFTRMYRQLSPRLVHIHGTELQHSYHAAMAAQRSGIPYIVSLQGIVSDISENYAGTIASKTQRGVSIRDFFFNGSLARQKRRMLDQAKLETLILKGASAVLGRTKFDEIRVNITCPEVEYFKVGEPLRKEFFEAALSWRKREREAKRIYVSQANTPLKGLHTIIQISSILKELGVNFEIRISGSGNYCTKLKKLFFRTAYKKYCDNLIVKNGLSDKITFIGPLNAREIVSELRNSDIFLQPSMSENSSNAFREAYILGIPIVASYVGGLIDYRNAPNVYLAPATSPMLFVDAILSALDAEYVRTDTELFDPWKFEKEQLIKVYQERNLH